MSENFWDKLMGNDAAAATYMETYGEGVGSDTRKTIGSFINDYESVLDVGCGPGWNYKHFQLHGPKVSYTGVDYSERFVRVNKQRWPEVGWKKMDCRKLEVPDGSYDVVLLQDVLEHTNGFETPLKEALRVARKRVIVSFWHLTDDDNPHINDDGDDGYGAWYDKRAWEKFLDSLDIHWMHTESAPDANRQHDFYIIDKEEPHGKGK